MSTKFISYYILQVINSKTLINMSSVETPANNCSIISIGNLTEKTSYQTVVNKYVLSAKNSVGKYLLD